MSIVVSAMYTVMCDKCGRSADDGTEYAGWGDEGSAEDIAVDADYFKDGDKHFCSDCREEDTDT